MAAVELFSNRADLDAIAAAAEVALTNVRVMREHVDSAPGDPVLRAIVEDVTKAELVARLRPTLPGYADDVERTAVEVS